MKGLPFWHHNWQLEVQDVWVAVGILRTTRKLGRDLCSLFRRELTSGADDCDATVRYRQTLYLTLWLEFLDRRLVMASLLPRAAC
ncbi:MULTISPECIES: hypothetical protein [unclassified Acidisoma]|uniref:hypothetical protein n=1 Tax=unclassified Acidisoma TaxID=2634065 RepID=UPI00131BD67E|nr:MULTISPECIES: hypothetical protein [unclassified Acidisoma]